MKFIISYHLLKVEHMIEVISFLFVNHATQKYTENVEIIKTVKKIEFTNMMNDPGAVKISTNEITVERRGVFCVKKAYSKG